MKLNKALKIIGTFICTVGIHQFGYSQTYTLPVETISPFGLQISDNYYIGNLNWDNATLSDTVAINPTAPSIEQYGSINLPPQP